MLPTIELVFIVASAISTVLSSSVLFTAIVFPSMRKRLFMQIIIYISICDVLASVGSAFGFPPTSSPMCPLQSFLISFFYKASWLWTCALTHQLYSVIILGRFGLKQYQMHLVCWLIPLVTTLLPLSTNTFGRPGDDDQDLAWCFIGGQDSDSAPFWAFFSFVLVLFIAFVLMTYFLIRIYWRYRNTNMKQLYPEVYSILDALMLYPPGFFITWGPNLVFSILFYLSAIPVTSEMVNAFNIVSVLATQSGSVLAIIFFVKSREARYRWHALLCGRPEAGRDPPSVSSRSASNTPFTPGSDEYTFPQDFEYESRYGFDDVTENSAADVYNPYGESEYSIYSDPRDKSRSDSYTPRGGFSSTASFSPEDRYASIDMTRISERTEEGRIAGWNNYSTSPQALSPAFR